jgi:hypothetical protein
MAKLDETKTAPGVPAIAPSEWAEHVARVKAARGKYSWVRTSSEEFSRRKQEEIDLETEKSERSLRRD